MDKKMILCKGLPGSGKSTWAREFVLDNPNFVRINRDDIRHMLTPDFKWGGHMEKLVSHIEYDIVTDAFNSDYSIIIDNTNLNIDYVTPYLRLAEIYSAKVEWQDFTGIELEVCIERDMSRGDSKVGRAVILGMYNRYLKPKTQEGNI